MSHEEALNLAYEELKPFSNLQRWEFGSSLRHLKYITNNFSKTQSILDAGCYFGILALALKILGYNIEAADKYVFLPSNTYSGDISKLEKIWSKYGLKVYNIDLEKEQLHKKYDGIINIAVIEHQPYPKNLLESLLKNLNSNGFLYISTPNVTNLYNRLRFFFGKAPMCNIEMFYNDAIKFYGHWREYTLYELVKMVELNEMKVIYSKNMRVYKPKRKRPIEAMCRILSRIIPGAVGDLNVVLAQKSK